MSGEYVWERTLQVITLLLGLVFLIHGIVDGQLDEVAYGTALLAMSKACGLQADLVKR